MAADDRLKQVHMRRNVHSVFVSFDHINDGHNDTSERLSLADETEHEWDSD